MPQTRRYIHEDIWEEDLWIDLSILTFLREEMLLGNLDYVSLREPYKQGLFSSDIDCSWERFRRRALYQIWLGFAEPLIVYGPEGEKINSKKHTGYLCSIRITPFGFMQIPELEKEVKKYEGFNRYITKIKKFNDRIMGMKWGIVLGITTFLIVCIFIFDIKVSKIIEKIPILSSIIDTQVLKDFEAINEKDEFYRALMTEDSSVLSQEISLPSSEQVGSILQTNSGLISSFKNNEEKQTSATLDVTTKNSLPIPNFLKKILPWGVKIADIKVRSVSNVEKLFRITLDNGDTRYINVKKYDGKYEIGGE